MGAGKSQLGVQLRILSTEVSYLRIWGGRRRKPGSEGGHDLSEGRHLFKNEVHSGVQSR